MNANLESEFAGMHQVREEIAKAANCDAGTLQRQRIEGNRRQRASELSGPEGRPVDAVRCNVCAEGLGPHVEVAGGHGAGLGGGRTSRGRGRDCEPVSDSYRSRSIFANTRWTQRALDSISGAEDFEFDDRTFRRRMIWSAVVAIQFLAAAAYAYFWLKNRGY